MFELDNIEEDPFELIDPNITQFVISKGFLKQENNSNNVQNHLLDSYPTSCKNCNERIQKTEISWSGMYFCEKLCLGK